MTIGIYCIEHVESGKKYIGKSKNIENRLSSHMSALTKDEYDKNENRHLWNAVKYYGIHNFEMYVVEELPLDESLIAEREIHWMDYYNTCNRNFGYNLRRDSETRMVLPPETIRRMSEARMGEKNPRFGKFKEENPNYRNFWSDEQKERQSERTTRYYFVQETLNGEVVRVWESAKEIKDSGEFNHDSVYRVTNKQTHNLNKPYTYKGFVWKKYRIQ